VDCTAVAATQNQKPRYLTERMNPRALTRLSPKYCVEWHVAPMESHGAMQPGSELVFAPTSPAFGKNDDLKLNRLGVVRARGRS